jgi:hypothetical protein
MKTAKCSLTHTHKKGGRRKGSKGSQPQQNNGETRGKTNKGGQQARGAHNKQAEQRKNKGGKVGSRAKENRQKIIKTQQRDN